MEPKEQLRQAFENCGLAFDENYSVLILEEELDEVNEISRRHADLKHDYQDRIEREKRKYLELKSKYEKLIADIDETEYNNGLFRDHRERVLREYEAIEMRLDNPDLEIY